MSEKPDEKEILELSKLWHAALSLDYKKRMNVFTGILEGVTTLEISIMRLVSNNPDIILKDIIDELGLPASTLSSAIDRLEKRDFIKRTISRRDRRSYGLELTENGLLADIEHVSSQNRLYSYILSILEVNERTVFLELLKRIIDRLKSDF